MSLGNTAVSHHPDVSVRTDRLPREALQDLIALVTQFVYPSAHVLQHLTLDLRVLVVEVRVEQALQDILGNLMNIDRRIVPSFDHCIDGVYKDDPGQVARGFIQNQIEVILAQEGVCRVVLRRLSATRINW